MKNVYGRDGSEIAAKSLRRIADVYKIMAEIDGNPVERTIQPIAVNRKNALFTGHDEGGKNQGRIASLIEACEMNDFEPFACLKATLETTASDHPPDLIDDLMPWAFKKASS